MKIEDFANGLHALYGDPHSAEHPKDRKFFDLCRNVPGMATENKIMLLNFAASLLEPGEAYLEVGSWKGLSILGAMFGNDGRKFIAIDNFSEFDGPREEFYRNIQCYGDPKALTFYDDDCFALFRSEFLRTDRVGVFFYDGNHSFSSQFHVLKAVERFLADEALLIIDDTSFPQVAAANALFIRYHPSCEMVFDVGSEYNGEPKWWNGVQVLAYRRTQARGRRFHWLVLRLAVEQARFKFEWVPAIRRYRRNSRLFSFLPNVIGQSIAHAAFRLVGSETNAERTCMKVQKYWRLLTGKNKRRPENSAPGEKKRAGGIGGGSGMS